MSVRNAKPVGKPKVRLLIAGSRSFTNPKLRPEKWRDDFGWAYAPLDKLRESYEVVKVISGCAPGADTLGIKWADSCKILVERYPADWDGEGKKAGMIRNRKLVEASDIGIFFWDGRSPGTKNCIDLMNAADKPVLVEYFK